MDGLLTGGDATSRDSMLIYGLSNRRPLSGLRFFPLRSNLTHGGVDMQAAAELFACIGDSRSSSIFFLNQADNLAVVPDLEISCSTVPLSSHSMVLRTVLCLILDHASIWAHSFEFDIYRQVLLPAASRVPIFVAARELF